MKHYQEIRYEHEGGIARVTLARPAQMNPLTPCSLTELRDALTTAERDPRTRVIVLAADGSEFSAGGELGEVPARTASGVPAGLEVGEYLLAMRQELREWHDDYIRMAELRVPVIAAVQGWCLGGGAWLAVAADITIAGDDAIFAQPEVRQGLPCGVIWALAAGWKQALRYSLTGDRLDAHEACRIGLVNEVVDSSQLQAHVDKLARRIAGLPLDSIVLNKQLIRRSMDAMGFRDALVLAAEQSGWLMAAWRSDVHGHFERTARELGVTAAARERDASFRPEAVQRSRKA